MGSVSTAHLVVRGFQVLCLFVLSCAAFAGVGYTVLCAFGQAPWLTLTATFGAFTVPSAGIYLQTGVSAILFGLLFFLPANARILALEKSHRDFRVTMQDIERAYHTCHSADRAGVFTLSSEFDAVRERLTFLRDHPDLGYLETDVLTVAAQMSQQARKLADIYSEEKVERARAFLTERQAEAEEQQARILEAMHLCAEIRKWAQQVEAEETTVSRQLARLDEQLQAALPLLGYGFEQDDVAATAPSPAPLTLSNVVPLGAKPAAE